MIPCRCLALAPRGQMGLQIFQALDDVDGVESCALVTQYAMNFHLRGEVPAWIELHDKVEVLAVGECVMELRNGPVVGLFDGETLQNGQLREGVLELLVGEDGALRDSFHR